MSDIRNQENHVSGYDNDYKDHNSYKDAYTYGELIKELTKLIANYVINDQEKVVLSTKSMAGFCNKIEFTARGFLCLKEPCG